METEPNVTTSTGTVSGEPEPLIKWGWLRALIIVPVWVLALIVVSVATVIVTGVTSSEQVIDELGGRTGILLQGMQLLGFMLPIFVFRKFIDRRSIVSLGYSWRNGFGRDFVVGTLGGIVIMAMIFYLITLLGGLEIVSIQAPDPNFLIVTLTFLIVAIGEESALRGYVLNNCMTSVNKYVALVATSVLFASMHLLNSNVSIIGIVNIALAGVMLGTYYIHRQNLWLPIGIHWTWNLFQGSVFGSAVSGETLSGQSVFVFESTGSDLISGGAFGFEASLVTSAVMVLATVALHYTYRRRPDSLRRLAA